MENPDIDLVGQTVGNMFYKVGIVDKDGKLTNQFVANASTNRVDIPESALGTPQSQVSQIPSTTNLFSGSAVGDILLSGVTPDYSNVQDGLLITLGNITSAGQLRGFQYHMDLSPIGLIGIKIPKEKLIINSSFDISNQLSQYIGRPVRGQNRETNTQDWKYLNDANRFIIASFGGTTIKVLPNATISINLTVYINGDYQGDLTIPVIQVNTYKN